MIQRRRCEHRYSFHWFVVIFVFVSRMTDSGSGTGVDKIMNRCKCFETGKSEINRRKCWITLNILNWRIKNKEQYIEEIVYVNHNSFLGLKCDNFWRRISVWTDDLIEKFERHTMPSKRPLVIGIINGLKLLNKMVKNCSTWIFYTNIDDHPRRPLQWYITRLNLFPVLVSSILTEIWKRPGPPSDKIKNKTYCSAHVLFSS